MHCICICICPSYSGRHTVLPDSLQFASPGSSITFCSTRGSGIEFRVSQTRTLDFFVNGEQKITDIQNLGNPKRKVLQFEGTPTGDWTSTWNVQPESIDDVNRVLSLYCGVSGETSPTQPTDPGQLPREEEPGSNRSSVELGSGSYGDSD